MFKYGIESSIVDVIVGGAGAPSAVLSAEKSLVDQYRIRTGATGSMEDDQRSINEAPFWRWRWRSDSSWSERVRSRLTRTSSSGRREML